MLWGILIGLAVGIAATLLIVMRRRVGTLVVYIPDQDESPYLFTELSKSIGDICRRKSVSFIVDIRYIHSREQQTL